MKKTKIQEMPVFPNLQNNLNNIQSSLLNNTDLLTTLSNSLTGINQPNQPNITNQQQLDYNNATQNFSDVADKNALHLAHTPFETESTTDMQVASNDGSQIVFDKSGMPQADLENNAQSIGDDQQRNNLLASLSAILQQ